MAISSTILISPRGGEASQAFARRAIPCMIHARKPLENTSFEPVIGEGLGRTLHRPTDNWERLNGLSPTWGLDRYSTVRMSELKRVHSRLSNRSLDSSQVG